MRRRRIPLWNEADGNHLRSRRNVSHIGSGDELVIEDNDRGSHRSCLVRNPDGRSPRARCVVTGFSLPSPILASRAILSQWDPTTHICGTVYELLEELVFQATKTLGWLRFWQLGKMMICG